MKLLIFSILSLFTLSIQAQAFFEQADAFFKQHVKEGRVDYQAVKSEPSALNNLLNAIAEYPLEAHDENTQKAFYINAYNLLVIKTVVDNYPMQSPQEKSGFFDRVPYLVAHQKVTLNELEKGLLFQQFPDPRLHFVLVCGAKGCPPITNFAYQPNRLEEQLTSQTKKALNGGNLIRIDSLKNRVKASELFQWYKSDFTAESGSLIAYFNQYLDAPIPENYKVTFQSYDWTLNDASKPSQSAGNKINIQEYTPSILMEKGQFEFKLFSNIYTQTRGFDENGNRFDLNERGTYFTQINQFLFGWTGRFNFGFDIWTNSVRIDDLESNPIEVLSFENNAQNRTALSGIGPKIKIAPFKKIPRLSLQSTFLVPIAPDMEGRNNGRPFLSDDAYLWQTQIFYDLPISSKFQLFFQSAAWVYFNRIGHPDGTGARFANPVSAFFSYFPTQRITLYYQNEFWPNFGDDFISSYFRQEGLGFKYQIVPGFLEGELLFTNFFAGRNSGAGQTYNFGLRIIR